MQLLLQYSTKYPLLTERDFRQCCAFSTTRRGKTFESFSIPGTAQLGKRHKDVAKLEKEKQTAEQEP